MFWFGSLADLERYKGCATTPICSSTWVKKKVAAARGPKSLATKLVDSSKKMKKEDSLMAEVPEPIITHGSTDFSLGSGLYPSASSCDT
jgi:hypothetical protein